MSQGAEMKDSNELIEIICEHVSGWIASFDAWAKESNILLPILLSVVAAIVFWLAFSYLPEKKRCNKLRPIVELALFDTYKQIFYLFDLVMRHRSHSPSFFQSKIRAGNLSENDIKLGLQNKCLNESYLYDPNVKDALLVVGEEILDRTLDIDELANKVLCFHTYATAEELVLLEKIREKIRVYDFGERHIKRPCGSTINGKMYRPVDPSISYRYKNFFELYQLFCQLQKLVLNHRPLDRDRFLYKMQSLYHSGQYKLCSKLIHSEGSRFEKDSTLYRNYLALSERELGRMKSFYKIIEDTYKSRPYGGALVSSRGFFQDLLCDNKLIEILAQFHSSAEISALIASVEQDQKHKDAFERENHALAAHYRRQVAGASAA